MSPSCQTSIARLCQNCRCWRPHPRLWQAPSVVQAIGSVKALAHESQGQRCESRIPGSATQRQKSESPERNFATRGQSSESSRRTSATSGPKPESREQDLATQEPHSESRFHGVMLSGFSAAAVASALSRTFTSLPSSTLALASRVARASSATRFLDKSSVARCSAASRRA